MALVILFGIDSMHSIARARCKNQGTRQLFRGRQPAIEDLVTENCMVGRRKDIRIWITAARRVTMPEAVQMSTPGDEGGII